MSSSAASRKPQSAGSSVPPTPSKSSTRKSSSNFSLSEVQGSIETLRTNYSKTVPTRIKLIDSFLLVLMVAGIFQFAYRVLVTSYPYKAFAGGFGGTVGQFILLAGLRFQLAPLPTNEITADEKGVAKGGVVKKDGVKDVTVSPERAFSEFVAASIALHLFMMNFLG